MYPLVTTGIGQVILHRQANGSLTANGSVLIGQTWTGARWFHGRPDADNPMATGGTNLGPRSRELVTTVHKQLGSLVSADIIPTADLATTSGSGVDPESRGRRVRPGRIGRERQGLPVARSGG